VCSFGLGASGLRSGGSKVRSSAQLHGVDRVTSGAADSRHAFELLVSGFGLSGAARSRLGGFKSLNDRGFGFRVPGFGFRISSFGLQVLDLSFEELEVMGSNQIRFK